MTDEMAIALIGFRGAIIGALIAILGGAATQFLMFLLNNRKEKERIRCEQLGLAGRHACKMLLYKFADADFEKDASTKAIDVESLIATHDFKNSTDRECYAYGVWAYLDEVIPDPSIKVGVDPIEISAIDENQE